MDYYRPQRGFDHAFLLCANLRLADGESYVRQALYMRPISLRRGGGFGSSLYGVADLATKRLFRYLAEQLFWKHMPVVRRRPISWPTRKQSTLSRAIGFGSRMNSRTFGRSKQPWDVQPLATWSRSSRQMRSRAPRLRSSGSRPRVLIARQSEAMGRWCSVPDRRRGGSTANG